MADELFKKTVTNLGFNWEPIMADINSGAYQKTLIKHIFTFFDRPIQNAIVAGAMVMWRLYRQAPLTVELYAETFKEHLREDVYNFLVEHADRLNKIIRYDDDFNMTFFASATFVDMYLTKLDPDDEPLEIPQFAWLRVATGEFCPDFEKTVYFYNLYTQRKLIPATPTIFNMGFKRGSSVSCILETIDDSIEDIFDVQKGCAKAMANNAGLGVNFGRLRHSKIGRQGKSKGLIPWVKLFDQMTQAVDQGGRRPGAITGTVKIHHFDIQDFIRLTDKMNQETMRVEKLNTSCMLTDLFMKRVKENSEWTVFCPKQTKKLQNKWGAEWEELYLQYEEKAKVWNRYVDYKNIIKTMEFKGKEGLSPEVAKIYQKLEQEFSGKPKPEQINCKKYKADSLYTLICSMQLKSGNPYINHCDNINRKNNMDNIGPVEAPNLCQEIVIPAIADGQEGEVGPGVTRDSEGRVLGQTGTCNLHSIALGRFVKDQEFQFLEFAEVVRAGIKALNKVIDRSHNMMAKAHRSNMLNRPVGLGTMGGGHDLFAKLNMPFVDLRKIPVKIFGNPEDEDSFRFMDILEEEPTVDNQPDYSEEGLLERELNPEAKAIIHKIWSCMYYNALLASNLEAKECGPYPNWSTSQTAKGNLQFDLMKEEEKITGRKYNFKVDPAEPAEWGQEGSWAQLRDDIKKWGLRNSLLLTCMPAASTSLIGEHGETNEFMANHIYNRKVLSGEYPTMNTYLVEDLIKWGFWTEDNYNLIIKREGSILGLPEKGLDPGQRKVLRFLKEKYLTMNEIPMKAHIDACCQRQPFIDQSQSLNLFIQNADVETLKEIHMYTWENGLKNGMYYLRTRSSQKPLDIGQNQEKDEVISEIKKESSKIIKKELNHTMLKISTETEISHQNVIKDQLMNAAHPVEVKALKREIKCIGCEN